MEQIDSSTTPVSTVLSYHGEWKRTFREGQGGGPLVS